MKAAGVLQDYDDADQLHVWCKKRFIEYFLAYSEMEQEGKFLLPEGELRDMLESISQPKALPAARIDFDELHKRGLEYTEKLKQSESQPPAERAFTLSLPPLVDIESRMAELDRQKKIILEKYRPTKKQATALASQGVKK